MLKRLVKEATGGFSSSGEQSSRKKKPSTRRAAASSEDDDERRRDTQKNKSRAPVDDESDSGDTSARTARRRRNSSKDESEHGVGGARKTKRSARKSADDTPSEEAAVTSTRRKTTSAADETRRKKAGRMKREPLLEYSVIETVHSAMHGKKKKRARQELLELFGSYDSDDTGIVDSEKFKKCIAKVGIKLKKTKEVDALVRCFAKAAAGDDDQSSGGETTAKTTRVDYVAFVEFACNVRDSERLSAIAVKLRDVIRAYDDKHDRATTVPYTIVADLKKLDKNKRGWIASDRFGDFMQDHERPTFRLKPKEIEILTERFEYEYDKGTLGFDYVQFARWLQPMLHLDKKELHARVKQLIKAAQQSGGWELDELFEAMDDSGDGQISASELKQALFDMGLPLTDAQIQCLVEEYDVNRDGTIQYEEFVSLFGAPKLKRPSRNQDSDGDSDQAAKKRAKAKANVRNTFSWAINKAFARKHAQANRSANTSKNAKRKNENSASSGHDTRTKHRKRKSDKESDERSESSSDDEKDRSKRHRTKRLSSKKAKQNSQESSSSEPTTKRGQATSSKQKSPTTASKRASNSSTESEVEQKKPTRRRHDEDSDSSESPHLDVRRRLRSDAVNGESRVDSSKRKSRAKSTASTASRRQTRTRKRKTSRTRSIGASKSPQRIRESRRSRSLNQPAAGRARKAKPRGNSAESHGNHNTNDAENNSGGSGSGLDLDQVRNLQKLPRKKLVSGNQSVSDISELSECDDGIGAIGGFEDESKSDRAYYKLLKSSLRRAFEFFDTERTETISKRNIGHVLRALGHEYSSRELDREISRADIDKNGEMDFYEFFHLVKRQLMLKAYLLSQRREMVIRQAFQSLDVSKNGSLDENEFEFLVFKVLQVELSVEEQDALLDAVEVTGDGNIHEDDFIKFMKTMEGHHKNGTISRERQIKMLQNLDPVSRLACSAVKKLIRGAPKDLDKDLLMLMGVPTNYRPALTSAVVCRDLHEISMEHALGFPCPETIVCLAQDPLRVSTKKESSVLGIGKSTDPDEDEAKRVLKQAEAWQAHAIVSLKRATGIPKPFDTREEDVIKRCVHVALYQEQEDKTRRRQRRMDKTKSSGTQPWQASGGTIVGNVHEIPVFWKPAEEDVWEFSRKSTKEEKYKFVVRTNNMNDRLFLLVEFIIHLRTASKLPTKKKRNILRISNKATEVHEMAACWCKIPLRTLLAQRLDVFRTKEKLWGGTIDSPIDIAEDEILRRRTGWRAITNAFTKPTPPSMGIKSVPVDSYPEEIQSFVRKMPPLIIAPFASLPIVAEYMTTMQRTMWLKPHVMAANLCEPVLKLLPQIIDDHEALSVFRRAFDAELNGVKSEEERQRKFQDLVLRMWPSFLDLLEKIPQSTVQDAKIAASSMRRLSLLSPTAASATQAPPTKGTTNEPQADHLARFEILQCSAQGKLRLRNVPVAAAPFHIREVTYERLI